MNPREQAVQHIASQILSPQAHHLGTRSLPRVRKESHHWLSQKLH